MRIPRREIPIIAGSFGFGLLIAFALVYLWVILSATSEESFNINAPRAEALDSAGLIGYTASRINARVNNERRTVRPTRGDLSFRATRITWQDARRPDFARVGEVRGVINASTAGSGNIVVRGAVISDADIYVEQTTAGGEWNYQRVIDRMRGEDSGGPDKLFVVNDLAVRNTRVRVNTPDRDFVIEGLAAQMPRVELSGPELPAPRVQVARATGTLIMDDERRAFAVSDARMQFPETGVQFAIASVETGETRLSELDGVWGGNLPGIGIRVNGRAQNVRFEDVSFLSPRLPGTGAAAFAFAVRPVSETRTEIAFTDGNIVSQGSTVRGAASVSIGGETVEVLSIDAQFDPLNLALVEQLLGDTLPYRGTVTGTARGTGGLVAFDVDTRLTSRDVREPFATHLTGTVSFTGGQLSLRQLRADMREVPLLALRAIAPGLPLSGTISGSISLTGTPGDAPLQLNVRLELAMGIAIVEGTLDLRGAEPAYDVTGRLLAVDVNELLEPDVPPVLLSAAFRLNGRGINPQTMDARASVNGRFTGWRTGPLDSLHTELFVRNGSITIDTAVVRLGSMSGQASGSWRFVSPGSGAIGYAVLFDPVTPFAPYLPGIGSEDASGRLHLRGTASGETGRIVFAGDASGSALVVGDWRAGSIEGRYRYVMGPAVPEVQLNLSAASLQTPSAGMYTTATAQLTLLSPRFELEVHADREGNGGDMEIFADGRIPPTGTREVVLHRMRMELGNEQWALAGPAVFTWGSEPNADVNIGRLDFRQVDGEGRVFIDGRVRPPASADFRVETTALPVGDLQRMLGMQPRVEGNLGLAASILVSNGTPRVNGEFQLDSAVVENVSFTSLTGDINYLDNQLVATARAVVDTVGALDLRAELPLDLSFSDSVVIRMRDTGPVRITLVSDRISLAPFAALSREVKDVTGYMTADLAVNGTVQSPELSGTIAVHDAAATIVRAEERYDSINGVLRLENQRATIEQFVARSDGIATASGSIEFANLNRTVFNIAVRLTDFRAAGVENQNAAQVNGDLTLTGPMDNAVLTGEVELSDGYFPVPTVFSSPLDDELEALALPGATTDTTAEPRANFIDNLRIDNFRVRAGESVWFAMTDARAQLEGTLTFNKTGDDIRITGALTGTRGQYTLRAGPIVRRFDVVQAEVRFIGEPQINPIIDITASRQIIDQAGRQIEILVRVGGTMRAPTLSLASADAANIPQSELLSFLLFGQSNVELTGTGLVPGQALVVETFWGGLTEMLSLELEDELLDAGLSFDIFQLRFGNQVANLTEPSVMIGKEITDNVFLTVESALGTLFGGGEPISNALNVRLEWRTHPPSQVRLGWELVNPARALRSVTIAQPLLEVQERRQVTFDFTKRWTW